MSRFLASIATVRPVGQNQGGACPRPPRGQPLSQLGIKRTFVIPGEKPLDCVRGLSCSEVR
jgi:hypothetical protein